MASAKALKIQSSTAQTIDKFGRDGVFTVDSSSFDTATLSKTLSETDHTWKVAPSKIRDSLIPGDLVQEGDALVLISQVDSTGTAIGFTPTNSMKVTYRGLVWRVEYIAPIDMEDVTIAYELLLRQ